MKLKIKELREEYQMTQKELAAKLDNVQRNVSNWENGVSEPDCETILKIAELFDISIDELFGREEKRGLASHETGESARFVNMFYRLSEAQRKLITDIINEFKIT